MTEGKPVPKRDFLAELEKASEPARVLLREAGTYINYLRCVVRDMLPYFPKDHPYHVGFSEAAAGTGVTRAPDCIHDWVGDDACAYCKLDELRAAAIFACSEIGCFCREGVTGRCAMCKLEKVING